MIVAAVFSLVLSEVNSLGEFFSKRSFFKKKVSYLDPSFLRSCHLLWDFHPAFMNVRFTGNSLLAFFLFPLDLLYGGLGEVAGVGFYKIIFPLVSTLYLKFFHCLVPLAYALSINSLDYSSSSNYLIFYLMILGNTFLFGAPKEYSKGAVLCILAHMLIDSLGCPYVGSGVQSFRLSSWLCSKLIILLASVKAAHEKRTKTRCA